jgi:hypothetical protein
LTTKITFRDVILGIREHAFLRSPYPVILSIENHCSIEQQKIMAATLREVLGDALFVPTAASWRATLPSPQELRYKVLVKGKRLKQTEASEDPDDSDSDSEEEQEARDAAHTKHVRGGSALAPGGAHVTLGCGPHSVPAG